MISRNWIINSYAFSGRIMDDCCSDKAREIEALRSRQSSTLKIVLVINAVMFVVELSAGVIANSVSLVADSLDMLGDALVYGLSIYVVARGAKMKAIAALFKGSIMAVFGFFVLGQAIYKIIIRMFRCTRPLALLVCSRLPRIASVWFYSGGINQTTSI